MGPLNNADTRSRYAAGVKTEVAIAQVREEVAALNAELARQGHIGSIGGAVSARVPDTDFFVISPPWAATHELAPQNTILCDLNGDAVPSTPGSENASSEHVATHAYLYSQMADVGGIVNSQSTYAASWSARADEIPCVLTAIADEFGGPIPVATLSEPDDDAIGRGIVATLAGHRSSAVLIPRRGPFTVGATAAEAVRSAVKLEDVARIVHIAQQAGALEPLTQRQIDSHFEQYHSESSQTTADRR